MSQRKIWTKEEDNALVQIVTVMKVKKWKDIAQMMEDRFSIAGRSGKQCRERWHNQLNPGIKSEDWTEEEERKLFSMHDKFGNRWAQIARQLPGRTDNCIKNHFYSTLRKAVRRLNRFIANTKDRGEMKQIKPVTLSKIITVSGERWNRKALKNDELLKRGKQIKERLIRLSTESKQAEDSEAELAQMRSLTLSIMDFNRQYKKKKQKKRKEDEEEEQEPIRQQPATKTRFIKRNIKKTEREKPQKIQREHKAEKEQKVQKTITQSATQKESKSTVLSEDPVPKSPNLKVAQSDFQPAKESYTENLLKNQSNVIATLEKLPSFYHELQLGEQKPNTRIRSQSRNLLASSSLDRLHMGPIPNQLRCKPSESQIMQEIMAVTCSTTEHPRPHKNLFDLNKTK